MSQVLIGLKSNLERERGRSFTDESVNSFSSESAKHLKNNFRLRNLLIHRLIHYSTHNSYHNEIRRVECHYLSDFSQPSPPSAGDEPSLLEGNEKEITEQENYAKISVDEKIYFMKRILHKNGIIHCEWTIDCSVAVVTNGSSCMLSLESSSRYDVDERPSGKVNSCILLKIYF